MAHPHHHALSSAKRFGGRFEDYLSLHRWFDASKAHIADARHRCLRHHSLGIFLAEWTFGVALTNSNGTSIPVRLLGEQHVQEDFSFIPSLAQCLRHLPTERWMTSNYASDTPSVHAHWSVKRFGGNLADYHGLHALLETSRLHLPDPRHRVLLHTTLGVQTAEEIFGAELASGVPTRLVAEAHIEADLGFIPTVEEALDSLPLEPWMYRRAAALTRKLGRKVPAGKAQG